MKHKSIEERMASLQSLVEGWKSRGDMPNIERDMALEELRGLYDAILNGEPIAYAAQPMDKPSVEDAPQVTPIVASPIIAIAEPDSVTAVGEAFDDALDIDALLGLSGDDPVVDPTPVEPVIGEAAIEEVAVEEKVVEEAAVEEAAVEDVTTEVATATIDEPVELTATPEPVSEPKADVIAELKPTAEPEPVAEPEPIAEPEPTFAGGLFDVDDIPVRSRSGRKMISIYNATPKQQNIVESATVIPATSPSSAESISPKAEPRVIPNVESKPIHDVESKPKRLGDVLGGAVTVLGDKMSADEQPTTVFNRITDIRKAIGLNDKFIMIKDLFDGDAERYESTIDTLNEFDDLDECMIYIVENFSWNPDSEGAKLLVSLIERKLA